MLAVACLTHLGGAQAITNSTYGHHGEMAFPEVTLVPWKANSSAYRKPKQQ